MEDVTEERGWRLVRHLPPTSTTWHPATDDLTGTDTYGDPNVDSSPWSVPFGSFDEFLFATDDGVHWLMATKGAVIGSYYDNAKRSIIKSSVSSTTYEAIWYRRPGGMSVAPINPWISTKDNAASDTIFLYGEGGMTGLASRLVPFQTHGGVNVFVRASSTTTSNCGLDSGAINI
jgi:hypothetical protein